MSHLRNLIVISAFSALASTSVQAQNIFIRDVPDYTWYAGCFGTASGNLMGFWDRNGFPNLYTGPTADGLAPLDSNGSNAGIRSLWASKAGFDGRPSDQPGHLDDYWEYFVDEDRYSYESSAPDPYQLAGRAEHAPDCVGDFIGASQNKWPNLDDECSGNIDAFSFNYWDKTGSRRENFTPPSYNGEPIRDIQFGWREWARSRGYEADTFSQLVDINPDVLGVSSFTFDDLVAEIDAGYPVMLFLQNPWEKSRPFPGMENGNPSVHGMIAYGYWKTPKGGQAVRYRTSWGDGDRTMALWTPVAFEAGLMLRGVIGFRPKPQIKSVTRSEDGNNLVIKWDGPSSQLENWDTGASWPAQKYQLEKASALNAGAFQAVGESTTDREATIPAGNESAAFFRVTLILNPPPSE